jgi:hypothetical protein
MMIKELGLSLRMISEIEVSRRRPDKWIITFQGEPIGSIEVKKPAVSHEKGMNNPNILGEVYDAVMELLHFSGCARGIAILIDGKHLRVCWVGEDPAVCMTDVEPAEAPPGGAGGDLAPAAAGDRHDSGGTAKLASGSDCPATPARAKSVAKISPPPRIPGTSTEMRETVPSQGPEPIIKRIM